MAFREVSVVQVKEAPRRWLRGEGERPIAHGVGIDRKHSGWPSLSQANEQNQSYRSPDGCPKSSGN